MHTPTQDEIDTARDVVTHPEDFADLPDLREDAWRTLVEARGGCFAARNIPLMTHAQPGRPARGVAASLARSMARETADQVSLSECIARALPATRRAIAQRAGMDCTPPTGGSAA